MRYRICKAGTDYVPALRNKELHMVGFSELGMAFFRDYLVFAFDFKLDAAIDLCERINRADETGTIFPKGFLTGIPVRFFRNAMNAIGAFKLQVERFCSAPPAIVSEKNHRIKPCGLFPKQ